MALLLNLAIGVGSVVTLEGIIIYLLCMVVMGFLVLAGIIWLLLFVKGAFKPRSSASLGSSLAHGREVDNRQQAGDPVQLSEENQSQPNNEHN